jgi:hypothetical protein
VTTSRKIRLAGHVARIVEMRNIYKHSIGKTERRRAHGRVDGRIILKYILNRV